MQLYDSFISARCLPYKILYQRGPSITDERVWVTNFVISLDSQWLLKIYLKSYAKQWYEPKFFCCSHPKKFTFPQKKHIMENHFFPKLYREMLLLFLKLGCSHFQLFAVSAFKTHLESCLVLFSKGWKKCFWFPPSVYRREILQFSTWFLTSKAGFSTKELL